MIHKISSRERTLINEAVNIAFQAGRLQASSTAKDTYKATEKRLYALPVLERKIEKDKEMLLEMQTNGARERRKSIVRLQRSGYRVSPEEMLDVIIGDLEATIAADEHEVETMRRALSEISGDQYYKTITGKYIDGKSDEEVAEDIPCEATTVWRHRKRLVQRLAVLLYGSAAI